MSAFGPAHRTAAVGGKRVERRAASRFLEAF
jgi:hypothetical protein